MNSLEGNEEGDGIGQAGGNGADNEDAHPDKKYPTPSQAITQGAADKEKSREG